MILMMAVEEVGPGTLAMKSTPANECPRMLSVSFISPDISLSYGRPSRNRSTGPGSFLTFGPGASSRLVGAIRAVWSAFGAGWARPMPLASIAAPVPVPAFLATVGIRPLRLQHEQ